MNRYIETWKATINVIITSYKTLLQQAYTITKESNDIRELASKQLKLLDEGRPNKDESMYKQANDEQKEFIDYLAKVICYGNLEGKDNICLPQ